MKIGVDITEISRIRKIVERMPKFLERVFTENEIAYFSKSKIKWESLAGNFAVKEAFSKYLKTGIGKMNLLDTELCHDSAGAPYILYKGERPCVDVSISHSGDTAIAVVCGEGEEKNPQASYIKNLLPRRLDDAHKGMCGRIFILAGSKGMTGAATLSALGALRSGAGLVTVGSADCEQSVLAVKLTEAMTMAFSSECGAVSLKDKEKIKEAANTADVFVIGPGMGRAPQTQELIRYLIKNVNTPMVVDADGLNALTENINILKGRAFQTIITPHEGEMALLCGKPAEEIRKNRMETAQKFAKETGAVVVLKGKNTIVTDGDEVFVNSTGNSGMATGGSGDVLSGVIGSLTAQVKNPYDGAVAGVFVHGRAGDLAAAKKGKLGIIASDITENVPYALKELLGE